MGKLTDIHMDEALRDTLNEAGIATTEALLEKAGPKEARKELVKAHGLDEKALISALNRADLARVKGVSLKFSDMLEEAGVDTVPELAQRNAVNLHKKLAEVNEGNKYSGRDARIDEVESWVEQAKELDRAIFY